LPLAGPAFPVQVLQGGLAIHIVQTPVHDAPNQTFKGMDLGLAAPDAGLRHVLPFLFVTRFRKVFTAHYTLR
jgi:hypothetical protein